MDYGSAVIIVGFWWRGEKWSSGVERGTWMLTSGIFFGLALQPGQG